MLIKIRVIPNAKITKIDEQYSNFIKIHIHAPNHENKANEELIIFLSKHYNIKKNKIKIIRGLKSKNKIIEIADY